MSAEENEAVFRRWIEAYNERDKQAEADARAPRYVAHAPGVPESLDSDAWEELIFEVFAGAFPDLRLTIEEIGCSDDTVAARIAFPRYRTMATSRVSQRRTGRWPLHQSKSIAWWTPRWRSIGSSSTRASCSSSWACRHTRSPAVAAHPRPSNKEAAPEVAREALRDLDATLNREPPEDAALDEKRLSALHGKERSLRPGARLSRKAISLDQSLRDLVNPQPAAAASTRHSLRLRPGSETTRTAPGQECRDLRGQTP